MYRFLSLYKISHRLWLMAIISILCVITISTIDAVQIRESLYAEKQIKTRHVVEAVYGVLKFFHAKEQAGKLSRKEAQAAALDLIKQLRYEDKEYFWLNDMRPTMIMHPFKPQLDGKDLANIKDPTGKRLFVDFVDTVRQHGAGFVDYLWPKPGNDEPVNKTSYVKGFQPWGWIIGSGIYIDDVETAYWNHWQNSLVGLLIVLSLLATAATILTKSITAPIQQMSSVMRKLAKGEADFNEGVKLPGNSEISQMARDFNSFVDKLHELVNQLMSTSESLQKSTNQVTSIAHDTNQSVDKQRAESDQVAAAMTELNAAASDVANNAAQAALAAEQANTLATESKQVLTKSSASIANLHDNIKTTTEVIRQLQNGSEQIGDIVETIQSISEQTNLLALNAAIEAARAGDQGRGFAVVADEVRELAKRTQDSTIEIEKMISQLQQGAEQAVKVVESGKTEAGLSVEHTQQTGQALVDIVDSIANIKEMNTQIATAAHEQSAVVSEISQNVTKISSIATDNAERASCTVDAASNMGIQLNQLMGVAMEFRLSQQDASFDFAAARTAHLTWVSRVEAHLDGRDTIGNDELVSHHNCALGKWYDGPGMANYGGIDAMRQIKSPHAQLHSTIAECIRLERAGDHTAAQEKLRELDGLSKQIVELLSQVEREVRGN